MRVVPGCYLIRTMIQCLLIVVLVILPAHESFMGNSLRTKQYDGQVELRRLYAKSPPATTSGANKPIILASFWNSLTFNNNKEQKLIENRVRIQDLKDKIYSITSQCQPNGLPASPTQQQAIRSFVDEIELVNPTSNPAYSSLMNGYWKMLYTDFTPAAASSGKLGPFVGDVYQDLDSTQATIRNILKIRFPPIDGALVASQRVRDSNTWEIEFDRIENSIFGVPLPVKKFKTQEIRLWQIAFLDNELRILRARRPEKDSTESFIFVLVRVNKEEASAD